MDHAFESIHQGHLLGKLTMADRVIFKGHSAVSRPDTLNYFFRQQGIPLKAFGKFSQQASNEIQTHAFRIAHSAGRPYEHLTGPSTAHSGQSKEARAREIAKRDGITQGLICVFATVETCRSFKLGRDPEKHWFKLIPSWRLCLHYYFYYLDPEFGLMHVRVQGWWPMQVQVYINGREWLCRQLDRKGIGYVRHDNALLKIDDIPVAQRLCDGFFRKPWHRLLDRMARAHNPWARRFKLPSGSAYYWCVDQCEIATDFMFDSREYLEGILPDLFEHCLVSLSAMDILKFVDRARTHDDMSVDHKVFPEGRRIKFRMGRNSIKMYDKQSVLRIETTINKSREFRVMAPVPSDPKRYAFKPLPKGVGYFARTYKIAAQSNGRFIQALDSFRPKRTAIPQLDRICEGHTVSGRRVPGINPVSAKSCELFLAVFRGQHLLNGFRNKDIVAALYPKSSGAQACRHRERVSRLLSRLRGHGLIGKVPHSRLYRIKERGHQVVTAAIRFRLRVFPEALDCLAA
jgi:hypothetical protein